MKWRWPKRYIRWFRFTIWCTPQWSISRGVSSIFIDLGRIRLRFGLPLLLWEKHTDYYKEAKDEAK